jgi:IclR family acetate operon transcriptional repressor
MTSAAEPAADGDTSAAKNDGMTARVVAVLDQLARTGSTGVGVRQLASELGLSRSAVHRVLQSLAEVHVARALPSGSYAPGTVMASWAALLASSHSQLTASADVLARLVDSVDETAYLFSYEWPNNYATVLSGRQSGKPVRYVLEIGSKAPLQAGAAGKAILAHLPRSIMDDIQLTGVATESSKDGLLADLAAIRERGYALSFGEHIPEACGVASVFYADDRPAGSIDITIPRYRMEPDKMDGIGKLVVAAAQDLSHLLGSSSPGELAAK